MYNELKSCYCGQIIRLSNLINLQIIFNYNSSAIPEKRRCTIYDKEGWKCNDQTCIPKDWVCDKNFQCENTDNSDEEDGCQLYPGMIN